MIRFVILIWLHGIRGYKRLYIVFQLHQVLHEAGFFYSNVIRSSADKEMMTLAMQENRISLRVFADNEVIVSVPNQHGAIVSERTLLSDVSLDGVSFITRHHDYYHPGQPVMLQIVMSVNEHQDDITAFGRVVWLSDPDISTCGEVIQPRIGISLNQGNVSRLLQ